MLKHWIAGQWIAPSERTQSVKVINPATEELLEETPLGTTETVDLAVKAAQKAFQSWRKTPAPQRVQPLFQLKHLMERDFESLAQCVTQEHGKTLSESRGSVRRAIQMVETACGIPSLMKGEAFEDIARGIDCTTVQRPMGVFAGIAPFNFPVMVPFWFWPFAIACGNTFVLKPSERVPLTSQRIGKLLEEAGLPPGVMNLVHGGREVSEALCSHPVVRGVSFVGSTPVARHVYTLACSHGKRVQALGGAKNMMVALRDILSSSNVTQEAVSTAFDSITGCAGERCLAGSTVLCEGPEVLKVFEEGSVRMAQSLKVGNGLEPDVHMGPLISSQARDRVLGLIERAIQDGAKILFDGRASLKEHARGFFLGPTVLTDIKPQWEIAREEIFGPVVLLAQVRDLSEALTWINDLPVANTATLFTRSGGAARRFAYEADPSMLGINIGVPAPMSFFSFGGSKDSFFGDIKAHGKAGISFYTDTYTTISRWNAYQGGSLWEGLAASQ